MPMYTKKYTFGSITAGLTTIMVIIKIILKGEGSQDKKSITP